MASPQWHLYDIHRQRVWGCATTGADMRQLVDAKRPHGYYTIWHSGTGEYWERKGGEWSQFEVETSAAGRR